MNIHDFISNAGFDEFKKLGYSDAESKAVGEETLRRYQRNQTFKEALPAAIKWGKSIYKKEAK